MKPVKTISAVLAALLVLGGCAQGTGSALPELPAPEFEDGLRGEQFGIDKNINEATIDQYLFRDDAVYRDMRMLRDEAEYEAIGGDSWLSGIVEGFEVVPYPYLCNVEGLPEEVGQGYHGETLFTHDENGYTANYEESMDILEYLFPKDKVIFLMCGGGGYAGMTRNMLIELGWDETKIYNTGGFWFYEGEHAVTLKREENGKTYYDFHKVNYHYIDFASLHRLTPLAPATGGEPEISSETLVNDLELINADQLAQMIDRKETFAVSVYLPGCSSCAAFAPVVKEVAASGQVPVYIMSLDDAKENGTVIGEAISYTPSVAVFKDGQLAGWLDASSDADLPHYKNAQSLSEWMGQYIEIDPVTGEADSQIEDCEDACSVLG